MVLPSIDDTPKSRQHPHPQPKVTISPKKSPYFTPSGGITASLRKRNAHAVSLQQPENEDESKEPFKPSKRRKHNSGSVDYHAMKLVSAVKSCNQPASPNEGEPTLSVARSESETHGQGENKLDFNDTGTLMRSIERTGEDAKAARKAAKKDRRARERAEHAHIKSSSQNNDPITTSPQAIVEIEAHAFSPKVVQRNAHEQGQTPDTIQSVECNGLNLKQSQSPTPTAPGRPVANATKSTKRKVEAERQETRRREVAVKERTDRAIAAEPTEFLEEVVRRKGESNEGVNVLSHGRKARKAMTPVIPGKKRRKRLRERSAEQIYQLEGFQSPMIQTLAEELDRSLSIAEAGVRHPKPPLTRQSTPRLRRSKRQLASASKLLSNTTDSSSPAQSQTAEKDNPESSDVKRPTRKGAKSIKVSPYFTTILTKRSNPICCIPFPPLASTHFGLVQETLAHSPFRLLLACIFLNKTRGSVSLPVFYDLMTRYPTPSALAAAKFEDVVDVIKHLGLQNQRANTCIKLAKAWLEREPVMSKRFRVLHYPCRGDGKDLKPDEVIGDEDERVAWEVGQLPGVGVYAIDSWRIFCRDELRGLPSGLPEKMTEESKQEEMQKEWTRVLPLDKELRAYLQWRWLRNGIVWDPVTGEKRPAGEEETETAGKGGVIYEGDDAGVVVAERKSQERTAPAEF